MKNFLILLFLFVIACTNDNNIVQRLAQEPAIVREVKGASNLFVLDLQNANSGLYSSYIVPNTTLPANYKKDGLLVLISGDVTSNSVAVDGYIAESEGNIITINGKYNMIEVTTVSKNIDLENIVLLSCENKTQSSNPNLNGYIKFSAINNNKLKVEQKFLMSCCCEDVNVEINSLKNNITISITDADCGCNCICPRVVSYEIDNLQINNTYKFIFLRNALMYHTCELFFTNKTDCEIKL